MDPLTLIMLGALALLIFFTVRNGRKRSRDMAAMHERTVVGAKVMTNFGLFGTIVAVDEEENQIELETTPGTVLTVHRQTIAKIITPEEVVSDEEAELAEEGVIESAEELEGVKPEYRQQPDGTAADRSTGKKLDD